VEPVIRLIINKNIKMKNLTKIISGALGLLVLIGLGASTTLAYRGDSLVKGPNYSPERHDAITKAFETNDYEAWAELMADKGRITQLINADNFSRFAEIHSLVLSGDIEEANKIKAELGLGQRNGNGLMRGRGHGHRGNSLYFNSGK